MPQPSKVAKRQLLFIQGGGAGAHDEWDSRLVENLRKELGSDYEVHYPRMPNEDDPSYAAWKSKLVRVLPKLGDGAILVGHSVGGSILVKALSERLAPSKLAAVLLLAAPFVGDGGWSSAELRFPPDLGARLPRVPIHFFHGLADETAPPFHVELYRRAVPQAHIHGLPARDHQLNDDLSEVAAVIRELDP